MRSGSLYVRIVPWTNSYQRKGSLQEATVRADYSLAKYNNVSVMEDKYAIQRRTSLFSSETGNTPSFLSKED